MIADLVASMALAFYALAILGTMLMILDALWEIGDAIHLSIKQVRSAKDKVDP